MTQDKKYSEIEMIERCEEARRNERAEHFYILQYLLNKNSHPLPKGLDYVKTFEEIEDYEHYLAENL